MENEKEKNKKSKNMKYVKHAQQISMEASDDDTVADALADPKKKVFEARIEVRKNTFIASIEFPKSICVLA